MYSMLFSFALAAPGTVPVQGQLTDIAGEPLAGTHSARLRLYGNPGSGDALMHSELATLHFDRGAFAALLGAGAPLDLDLFATHGAVTFTLEVGGVESARVPVGHAPLAAFAARSGRAALADHATTATTATTAGHAATADSAATATSATTAATATNALAIGGVSAANVLNTSSTIPWARIQMQVSEVTALAVSLTSDLASTFVQQGGSYTQLNAANDPFTCTSGKSGSIYFNTTSGRSLVCNGTTWQALAGTASDQLKEMLAPSSCPSDMVMVGLAGTESAFCIEKEERASTWYQDAVRVCANAGRHVCSGDQWYLGSQVSGVNNMCNHNWEWTNTRDHGYTNGHLMVTYGAAECTRQSWSWADQHNNGSTTNPYRCCQGGMPLYFN